MEVLIETLFETEWGLIVLGICLIGAILIEIFGKKPKI